MNYWLNNEELKRTKGNKKIILYGRSEDWIHKTFSGINKEDIKYIVDKNPSYHGTKFYDLDVSSPEKLTQENLDDIYIIITAGPYLSVINDLDIIKDKNYKKFLPGVNYCCTPAMYDWAKLMEIKSYDKNLIITCGDYDHDSNHKRKSKMGGGIFKINTKSGEYEKKISGQMRGIIKIDENYATVDHFKKEIVFFNNDFQIVDRINLSKYKGFEEKPNFSGICFDKKNRLIYVANTGSDQITIVDFEEKKILDKINFSDYPESNSFHHINDLSFFDNKLLVSYFSFSGNWKNGIFDGGVTEIDIKSHKKCKIIDNLWMPHSVSVIKNNISILNSMEGELIVGNDTLGIFPGFMRGLFYDGNYFFIGQSETMYMSRLFGRSKNIMCNAGIYIFDSNSKASRFISCPDLMNVYGITDLT